jgi:hypothetical protein
LFLPCCRKGKEGCLGLAETGWSFDSMIRPKNNNYIVTFFTKGRSLLFSSRCGETKA